jgi:hypothetical protein
MRRALTAAALALVGLAIAIFAAWSSLALGHRLPGPGWLRMAGAGAAGLAGVATIALLFTARRWRALAAYGVLALSILGWWSTIRPPAVADFAPDVARQVTGRIAGDQLMLQNVRNFAWRTADEAEPRWEERAYDLRGLRDLDLFLSHWDDSGIAHMVMSFGFADGRWLAWSVEVRRLNGSVYSPISGLFKTDPVVLIAAEEMDVVGVRTNLRGEDVFRYRLNLRPETIRSVLTQFVAQANTLAERPEWYHTLTTNCTTSVVAMMRAVGATVPLDWRLVLNGRLPEYAYDHDALEAGLTLAQAKAKAPVSARAKAHGLREGFSAAIR